MNIGAGSNHRTETLSNSKIGVELVAARSCINMAAWSGKGDP
jgi:hypothetical protein